MAGSRTSGLDTQTSSSAQTKKIGLVPPLLSHSHGLSDYSTTSTRLWLWLDSPLVVLPSAGGRAGVGGVAAEVVVDLLPGLLLGASVVAANLLNLLEKQMQVD